MLLRLRLYELGTAAESNTHFASIHGRQAVQDAEGRAHVGESSGGGT